MSAARNVYMYAARTTAYMTHETPPAIVSISDSPHDYFIYLRIINAHPTLIPKMNEFYTILSRHVYQ